MAWQVHKDISLNYYFSESLKRFQFICCVTCFASLTHAQGVPGGKVNIVEGRSVGHSKQKYVRMSYSERFPRQSYFTVETSNTP
jgi:hypothetical protein